MNRHVASGVRLSLKLHPDSVCEAVTRIEAVIARPSSSRLVLGYFVTGAIDDIRIPPPAAPTRADALWQHTCFEAFLRAPPDPAYYEFNVAPSRQWATYRFNDYRSGMSVPAEAGDPRIDTQMTNEGFELTATLDLDRSPDLPDDAPLRLGLSAVIEETNGRKSYWALAHPGGKADFHHADCFTHQLPGM